MPLLFNNYVTYRRNAFCEFYHFGVHKNFVDTPFVDLNTFKDNIKQLADIGIKFLDSPDDEEHNRIRKVDCFKFVFNRIEIAKSLSEFPDILFMITNKTYNKLPLMHQLTKEFGLILIVNPVSSCFGTLGFRRKQLIILKNIVLVRWTFILIKVL